MAVVKDNPSPKQSAEPAAAKAPESPPPAGVEESAPEKVSPVKWIDDMKAESAKTWSHVCLKSRVFHRFQVYKQGPNGNGLLFSEPTHSIMAHSDFKGGVTIASRDTQRRYDPIYVPWANIAALW